MNVYEPLAGESIRLLAINPDQSDQNVVECELVTASLDDAPPYVAVSYAWGQDDSPTSMRCNGVDVPIAKVTLQLLKVLRPLPTWKSVRVWSRHHDLHHSHNVWGAFARNRSDAQYNDNPEHGQPLFWIDAICINQQDMTEKAHQVAIMDAIYRSAQAVKVWLGNPQPGVPDVAAPVKDGMGRVPRVLPYILSPWFTMPAFLVGAASQWLSPPSPSKPRNGNRKGDYPWQAQPTFSIGKYGSMPIVLSFIAQVMRNIDQDTYFHHERSRDNAYRNLVFGLPDPQAPEWDVVSHFFQSPWFYRIWVVQEIALARRAVVIVGDWEIEWSALGKAAFWFYEKGFGVPTTPSGLAKAVPRGLQRKDLLPVAMAAELWQMHDQRPDQQKLPLLELLRRFRMRGASQQKDRLYAAYSLAKETDTSSQRVLDPLIQPDYTEGRSLASVYGDSARYLIIDQAGLSVLSYVGNRPKFTPGGNTTDRWPSWVPDWSHEKVSTELINIPGVTHLYAADGGQTFEMAGDSATLSVRGFKVATIETYGGRLFTYTSGQAMYREDSDFIVNAHEMIQENQDQSNAVAASDCPDSFLDIITAGVTDAGSPVTSDPVFVKEGKDWVKFLVATGGVTTVSGGETNSSTTGQTRRGTDGSSFFSLPRWTVKQPASCSRFRDVFVRACNDRRFFVAQSHTRPPLMGIGPENMREGDVVAVLVGAKVPFVLRRVGGSDQGHKRFALVGECYVPVLMNGEAAHGGDEPDWFDIA